MRSRQPSAQARCLSESPSEAGAQRSSLGRRSRVVAGLHSCSVGSRASALIRGGLARMVVSPAGAAGRTERTRCFTWSAYLDLPVCEVNESTPSRAPRARQQGGGPRWPDTSDCQWSHAGLPAPGPPKLLHLGWIPYGKKHPDPLYAAKVAPVRYLCRSHLRASSPTTARSSAAGGGEVELEEQPLLACAGASDEHGAEGTGRAAVPQAN